MKYIKADTVLPDKLVEELQKYIQGGYIYIPLKIENKKKWGEVSGIKEEIKTRNENIKRDFKCGKTVEELVYEYYLSEHSIKKIIYSK